MRTLVSSLVLLMFTTGAARAQLTAAAAYDTVQRMRDEADAILQRDPAAAVRHLRGALAFLDRPDVHDLALGWPYLRAREPNVWWDIAIAATQAGDTTAALAALEQVQRTGGSSAYIGMIERDSSVHRWSGHPRVRAVVDQLRRQRRLAHDSAFASPYRDTLPEAERVAGLSLVWAEVRYAYPDFSERPELDWDSLYLAYVPRVLRTTDTQDYYRTLMRFVAELGDSHTNVYFPADVSRRFGRPPIQTRLVEGRVLVTAVLSPSVESLGVRIGDEIVAVDGVPVHEYAEREVTPYQPASTPQDRHVRSYTYFLLTGPRGTPVRLDLRHADGTAARLALAREGYRDLRRPRPPVTDSILPGNIGYLRIATFGNDSVEVWARRSLLGLMDTRALIIDLRENDGGNTRVGPLTILARDSSPMASQRIRNYSALYRARGFESQPLELGHGWVRPDPALHYDGPVALLIGPQTFSAGEDFAVAFDLMRRGTIVGEPSGGNTGQPLRYLLPGGGSARVRTKHDHYGDGRAFLFRGVLPAVLARPTVAGVRAGRDEALEAAVRVVTGGSSGAMHR